METFDVELLYLEYLDTMGPERPIRDRNNHFYEMDDAKFSSRYRFSKSVVLKILEEIEMRLEYPSNRNRPLTPVQQLLMTLRFFATGSFQLVLADIDGVSKSTVCRCVKRVSKAIAALRPKYVQFPRTEERRTVIRDFYNIAEFPGVLGAVDCTHIPIISAGGDNAEVFRNRKSYFSINVQTVSDGNLLIRNIVARWPGSVHDSYIFDNCELRMLFENEIIQDGHLLGDNGYRLRKYVLTPFLNTTNNGQEKYNKAHIETRNVVERQYGVWKRRFPVLSLGIRTSVESALTIIVATSVLHNIAMQTREEDPPQDIVLHEYLHQMRNRNTHYLVFEDVPVPHVNVAHAGADARNRIVQQHFM